MSNQLSIPSTRCELSVVSMTDLTDLDSIFSPISNVCELKYTATKPERFVVGDKWDMNIHSITDESSPLRCVNSTFRVNVNGKMKRGGYVVSGDFMVNDVVGNDVYLSSLGHVSVIWNK